MISRAAAKRTSVRRGMKCFSIQALSRGTAMRRNIQRSQLSKYVNGSEVRKFCFMQNPPQKLSA
jgi:hypothetical protein